MQRSKTFCDMTSSVRITSSRGERNPDLTTIRHDMTVLETNVAEFKAEVVNEVVNALMVRDVEQRSRSHAESKRLDTSTE